MRLLRVTATRDGDTEVLRLETSGGSPGYSVRYVDTVRIEDEPVLVQGDAALEIVLESADPNAEEGLSPDVTVDEVVDLELIEEIRFARFVAGAVTYAIGLSTRAPYTVEVDETGLTLTFHS